MERMGKRDGDSGGESTGESGGEQREGQGARPGLTRRRALWIGGGGAVAAGVAALVAGGEPARWWWRLPWNEKPRTAGAVDFRGAQWVAASPENYRRADRPADYGIDRVVIHVVQGSYATALDVFRNPFHEAAAHYVIRKDGHVAQTVRELDVAFHAGNRGYNERSVGIEHEGYVDRPESFTAAMYASSARLTAGICRRYGFPADREHIVGHGEVPGTDHTDPGKHWDWDRYLGLVRAELHRRPEPAGSAPPAQAPGSGPPAQTPGSAPPARTP
ncbi:N-acetylmuramoyl-L-alanine amidase [Streptomyces sp. CA2R101]|uniref:N-acetylmuramoyl-L-alanine amidase n=1 Tax=Streptomyces sp. CA2R101 TaxID=3120152 RepID=UPI0030096F43